MGAIFGLKVDLGRAGVTASEIGSATGLGSENNKKLISQGKKPFFNWIFAGDEIATARGGGGGLALWRRDRDMETQIQAEQAKVELTQTDARRSETFGYCGTGSYIVIMSVTALI